MSETPISPLRARMLEDMRVRKFREPTQKDYIRHVKSFSIFLGRSPATATPEDLRRYQVRQSREGVQPSTMNSAVSALRFFFRVTLDRPEMCRHLTQVRQERKLPVVLSKEEVRQLLETAPGVKYKAALSVASAPVYAYPRSPTSRSPISTASACCCASNRERARRTDTRCSRLACW